jgi:hypothetical protein
LAGVNKHITGYRFVWADAEGHFVLPLARCTAQQSNNDKSKMLLKQIVQRML